MRIKLHFNIPKNFYLPVSHNEILQGFIYHHLERSLADYVHDEGFNHKGRKFRLFTFSRILGDIRFDKTRRDFHLSSSFTLVIASPVVVILESLARTLVNSDNLQLNGNEIILDSIDVQVEKKSLSNSCVIRMLSPVTVYSTLQMGDGRTKTYYYNPREKEFGELIRKNLEKKYELIYKKPLPEGDFEINMLGSSKNREKIITYKDYIIKGWMGDFEINGPPELILTGLDAGLGAKNSQGFGCFEILKER